jgi:hypothetical protein
MLELLVRPTDTMWLIRSLRQGAMKDTLVLLTFAWKKLAAQG